ncbi:MAG: MopE-related protein [Sandaracinaceae bacterium]
MKARLSLLFALTLCLFGCDESPDPSDDGGPDASTSDAGRDAAVSLCAANRDCDDGLFCNGSETCEPGASTASAEGCVPGTAPCASASCDEAGDQCSCATGGDTDEDGEPSLACGGDDCDDDDPNRYPGNAEGGDAEGHDEDCDPATLGGTDADTDGFVSALCCNGDICGDDCADDDINVNPGATESCDGVDNNCSGSADVSSDPLCPGGTCTAGSCRLEAWVRTFGATGGAQARDVALDPAGNIYVVGDFGGEADFGMGVVSSAGGADAFVASYRPDGTLRWERSFGHTASDIARKVAVDGSGNLLLLVEWTGTIDFGGGELPAPSGALGLVGLRATDGAYSWSRSFERVAHDVSLGGLDSGFVVGTAGPELEVGSGEPLPPSSALTRYAPTGEWLWSRVVSLRMQMTALSVTHDVIAVTGFVRSSVNFGGEVLSHAGNVSGAVARFELGSGAHLSSSTFVSSGDGRVLPFATLQMPGGRSCLGGYFSESIEVSPGVVRTAPVGETNGFMICLSEDGAYYWDRIIPGTGREEVTDFATDSSGNINIVGTFSGSINLGSGFTDTVGSQNALYASYAADGSHIADEVFPASESAAAAVAVGPADSTVVAGYFTGSVDLLGTSRVAPGGIDGFVVRLRR